MKEHRCRKRVTAKGPRCEGKKTSSSSRAKGRGCAREREAGRFKARVRLGDEDAQDPGSGAGMRQGSNGEPRPLAPMSSTLPAPSLAGAKGLSSSANKGCAMNQSHDRWGRSANQTALLLPGANATLRPPLGRIWALGRCLTGASSSRPARGPGDEVVSIALRDAADALPAGRPTCGWLTCLAQAARM